MTRINFESLPWVQAADGLRYKIAERGARRVRLLEFAPGYADAEQCVKSHTGYVLEGLLEVEFDDRAEERFMPGDALVIEGEPHRAKAGDEGALVFLVEDV
jgi:quercetin dioxygenase-like cupin family protein